MWVKERHNRIVALLEVNGQISINRLVTELNVSRESVRRDIIQLEEKGKLLRIHGGVTRTINSTEPPLKVRRRAQNEIKQRIASAAAQLVHPGMMCAVDAGSTTTAFAASLAGVPGITVVTNSIDVARIVRSVQKQAQVILLAGSFGIDVPATYGILAVEGIRRFRCDIAFFSPVALSTNNGASNYDLAEAEFARAMIDQAGQVVALADSTKIGSESRVTICPAGCIDILVTDEKADALEIRRLKDVGMGSVIIC